jgi:mannose-6-phosphate isomerase-like protein (cupin superfamily)
MADLRFRVREHEGEALSGYEAQVAELRARVTRAHNGEIVMRAKDIPFERSRQGVLRYYLNSLAAPGTAPVESAVQDWDVFLHSISVHSGAHRHQGGLVIYVIRGSGYTVVEGDRKDWKEGDLLLLPVQPGGVVHQHFNTGDEPAEWIAFIYRPMQNAIGSFIEQVENAP